jgi:hypothetical protein
MIWWFLILGLSTLVVVCVGIALLIHLRHNLHKTANETAPEDLGRQTNHIKP